MGRCATRSPPAPAGGFLGVRDGCGTRSPGWKPGDTGHENHPAIHATRRRVIPRFEPASQRTTGQECIAQQDRHNPCHALGRTAGAAPAFTCARPARRMGRACPGPRRPGNLSGVARRDARDRHPQPLTGAVREASKPGGGGLGDGLRRGKNIAIAAGTEGEPPPDAQADLPRLTSRSSARKPLRKCHRPGYPFSLQGRHGPSPLPNQPFVSGQTLAEPRLAVRCVT